MANLNRIIILGSGTSTGVPTLGCQCHVCQSNNPKNKRFRSSILIQSTENKMILIDASTDLRTQLLNNKISNIDAAIITHEHADHTHGIDDLRPFCFYKTHPIPIYTSIECAEILKTKFPYIFQRDEYFKDKAILGGGIPKLDLHTISSKFENIAGMSFQFFKLKHGHTHTLGFSVGKFAYLIDCEYISEEIIDFLKNRQLDCLIIDCLRRKKHDTHLHLDLTLEYAHKIAAKQTGLIHLSHEFEHDEFTQELKDKSTLDIFPVYDQQTLTFRS
jgi:phosphoribosyl 1,2-cyclic phosphate phosphodiesterase